MTTRAAFLAETARPEAIAFVDFDLFYQIDSNTTVPIVGIIDTPQLESLARAVAALDALPWLSHLVTTAMLSSPRAAAMFAALLERIPSGPQHGVLGVNGRGRVALLARASRREARLDRMCDYFTEHGLSERSMSVIRDVAEELVTNALYDAPVEAGFFKEAVSRTVDVELPADRACEISYGVEADGAVFVRIRDMFGSLTRERLMNVLERCNTSGVSLDESRGGAGLGMWRIFSVASIVNITVVPGRLTDILIVFATKSGKIAKQLLGIHLCFVPDDDDDVIDSRIPDSDCDFDQSITILT